MSTTTTQANGTLEITKYNYDNNGNLVYKGKDVIKVSDPFDNSSYGVFVVGESLDDISTSMSLYEYNEWNQLVAATTGDQNESYIYNGSGYRVQKTANGQPTRFLYEYDKIILETRADGTQTAYNVYGTNLISRKMESDTAFYIYNGHGDVTVLLNSSGSILATYYYDAFGNILETNENTGISNPYRYAGYQYDDQTGLYYLNARYYDSVTARFISEDTYRGQANDPLSLNLYTYCANNPIRYVDPTGHKMKGDQELLNEEGLDWIKRYTNEYNSYKSQAQYYKKLGNDKLYNNFKEKMAEARASADEVRKTEKYWNPKDTNVINPLDTGKHNTSKEDIVDSTPQSTKIYGSILYPKVQKSQIAYDGTFGLGVMSVIVADDATGIGIIDNVILLSFVPSVSLSNVNEKGRFAPSNHFGGGALGHYLINSSSESEGEELTPEQQAAVNELRRPYIRKSVRNEVEDNAPKTSDGEFIDPNTGLPIEGKYDLGHKSGNEFWREKEKAQNEGLTQKQFNDRMNNPDYYQIESPSSNRSHKYQLAK